MKNVQASIDLDKYVANFDRRNFMGVALTIFQSALNSKIIMKKIESRDGSHFVKTYVHKIGQ